MRLKVHLILIIAILVTVDRVQTDLFIVLLECGHVLTGLGEFALLHTLTDVPVDKGALGVHQVELVIKTRPGFGNSSCIGEHTDGALDFGHITTGNDGWFLIVNTDFEASWTPVDKLNRTLGFDVSNGGIDILGDYITAVEKTTGHVLSMTWITLDHLNSTCHTKFLFNFVNLVFSILLHFLHILDLLLDFWNQFIWLLGIFTGRLGRCFLRTFSGTGNF